MIRSMRPITAALVLVGALAVSGCGGGGVQPAAPASASPADVTAVAAPAPSSSVPAAAIAVAQQLAQANTDGTPVVLVRTETLTPAEAAHAATHQESDDIAYATHGAPAYVITFRGTFTGRALSRPAGAPAPHGRYFSVGINGADMSISGLGLTGDEPAPLHHS